MTAIEILPVVVGINHWRDVTSPFLDSIRWHHPTDPVLVVDNHSKEPYPAQDDIIMLRTNERLGYNEAMNYAARLGPVPDWYVFLNNDCLAQRPFLETVKALDPKTVYGSGQNIDGHANFAFQWSAWMCISQEVWRAVGEFDPILSAGFEDFDYQLRAVKAGFGLSYADLNIQHLDRHTRKEEHEYDARWRNCMRYFAEKHNWFIPDLGNPGAAAC